MWVCIADSAGDHILAGGVDDAVAAFPGEVPRPANGRDGLVGYQNVLAITLWSRLILPFLIRVVVIARPTARPQFVVRVGATIAIGNASTHVNKALIFTEVEIAHDQFGHFCRRRRHHRRTSLGVDGSAALSVEVAPRRAARCQLD